MKNIVKIILTGVMTLSLVAACVGCGKNSKTFEGYIIDEHCYSLKEPEEETVMCLQMEDCESSGYGIAVISNDQKSFIKFNKDGHEKAKQFITENKDKKKLGQVIVKGQESDEGLNVEKIEFKEK